MKIGVIGAGYLGAVHAACMAELGHDVVTYEIDPKKVEALSKGISPFYEPGLDTLLASTVATGRLTFSTEPASLAGSEVIFLCVGTPQMADGMAADTSYVYSAIESVVPHLEGEVLIAGKSTVPVGTAVELRKVAQALAPAGVTVELMWNPEFLREGFAVEDTLRPDRFVYGVFGGAESSNPAAQKLDQVYAVALAHGTPRIVTDPTTAELVKVSANAFLATKISFINAMAEICEIAGGDVLQLAEAIGHDARIGHRFLGAGVGFGGGCLPKDIRAFQARAGEIGATESLLFLREMDAINLRRREKTVNLAREAVGGDFSGKKITILGAAFKPNSDDIRDSPALDVAWACHREGAMVVVHDPKAIPNAQAKYGELTYEEDLISALTGSHVVLHLTEWRVYRELDPKTVGELVNETHLIDGRNALDREAWQGAGWTVTALGRG